MGVDLGGTKVAIAVVDSSGKVLFSERIATRDDQGPDVVISDLVDGVRNSFGQISERPLGVGIGVAGQVDDLSGAVLFAPNLQWRDVPLKAELEEALDLPVFVTNDVRAATWGEWLHGAGLGVADLVCVFVGTGIGGGVISGGRMLHGCSNTAGEVGHMTVVTDGRKCSCGGRGCVEAYAGGWALAARAQERLQDDPEIGRAILDQAGDAQSVTAATIGQAYLEGDDLARQIIEEAIRHLAAATVTIVNAFNPCRIILGGGVIRGIPEIVEAVDEIVRSRALSTALTGLKIVPSDLLGNAGAIGAGAFAKHSATGEVSRLSQDPQQQ